MDKMWTFTASREAAWLKTHHYILSDVVTTKLF